MKVLLAKHSGFCYGVKRAIKILEELAKKTDKKIYTYGPIIHNPQEVERLKKLGIEPVDNLHSVSPGILVIRSHGAPVHVYEEARKLGFEIVDATCPFVKKVHEYAKILKKEGYKVILIGEKKHPEVLAITESIDGIKVIENEEEAKALKKIDKAGVVVQTTFSKKHFKEIIKELSEKIKELKVINTICDATDLRQKHALELAKNVDIMIVIGGRNSANTRRLYELIKESGKKVYHIETADEIQKEWFNGVKNVGVTAGASTPDWIISSVIKKLEGLCGSAG